MTIIDYDSLKLPIHRLTEKQRSYVNKLHKREPENIERSVLFDDKPFSVGDDPFNLMTGWKYVRGTWMKRQSEEEVS